MRRGLAGKILSPRATRLLRAVDWGIAAILVAYAGWCCWTDWPSPSPWPIASAAVSVAWAALDWKSRLDAQMRGMVVRNR